MQTKTALRRDFLKLRKTIPSNYREQAMQQAAAIFADLPNLQSILNIACYLPTQYEFDTAAIIETIWQKKAYCYLPMMQQKDDKQLAFVLYEYEAALRPNRVGILEPALPTKMIEPINLDIVITPLIAFDLQGNRLGTGGGYYDYSFRFIHETTGDKRPYFLGLGFASQQTEIIPFDPWDIKLNAVLTEEGVREFGV